MPFSLHFGCYSAIFAIKCQVFKNFLKNIFALFCTILQQECLISVAKPQKWLENILKSVKFYFQIIFKSGIDIPYMVC